MRIVVTISPSDLIAFNVYHYDHAYATRWVRLVNRYGASVILAFLGVVLAGMYGRWGLLFPVLLVAALGLMWAPWATRRTMMRMLRKAYNSESAQGLLGRHEFELGSDGLLVLTGGEQLHVPWSEIPAIVSDTSGQRVYVYTGESAAHIIPLEGALEGRPREFVAELRRAWLAVSARHEAAEG